MAKEIGGRNGTRSNALWGAGGRPGDSRTNALWGSGSRPGDSRTNALWGKGGRGSVLVLAFVLAMAVPMAATGKDKEDRNKGKRGSDVVFVPASLLEAAEANPKQLFPVIVQGAKGNKGSEVGAEVESVSSEGEKRGKLGKAFKFVSAASAELTGKQILKLAEKPKKIAAITPDLRMKASALDFTSKEKWPYATGAPLEWALNTLNVKKAPAIAFIDSGIEASRPEFSGRVLEQVTMTSLTPNSPGDGRGHGTFVASIAASSLKGKAGVSPSSKIVMIDVMDDNGMAMTSDVINAVDWVIQNKDRHGIRVLNMSLHSTSQASFMFDPLDRAVEQAWFNGIVVVAAAGNYRTASGPSGVPFAPGNDPFIITVGAADIAKSIAAKDDFSAPWSAYGYTLDGFSKPDLGAPGRFMKGAVPMSSTLWKERPGNRAGNDGYMQMSGTSFSAPVVAGAAALVLAEHPEYTPDQVKGALMVSASAVPSAEPMSLGVGAVNVPKAADVVNPPNPNLALNAFVTADASTGAKSFDAASWASKAQADASWNSASWASASWHNASWASASWNSASWASASWNSASWASASWASNAVADASWASASWASASWASSSMADNADNDPTLPPADVEASDPEISAFEFDNGLTVSVLTGEPLSGATSTTTSTTSTVTSPVGL